MGQATVPLTELFRRILLLGGSRLAQIVPVMLAAAATPALAAVCDDPVGTLESAEGDVQVQDSGDSDWRAIGPGEALCKAATIRTGSMSRAAVVLLNDEVLRLDQDTTLKLEDVPVDVEKPSLLGLAAGAVQSFSRKPRKVNVDTAYMTLAIRGTEFVIRADADKSTLTVFEGEVVAANAKGEVAVPRGQAAVATADSAPQAFIVAKPRDAAQWSLYFPPIFSAPPAGGAAVDEARRLVAANDFAGAIGALEAVPAGERTAGIDTYRAALLLQVGRVGEAQAAIDAALVADPAAADAYALRSVIAIVQNQRDQALADARKAVELAPSSAPAKIALSYAQQSALDLEGARATMEQAVAEQPEDALAWSRLSELWLMAGFRDKSREAADRAAALVPKSERVQTVRGFADLVEFRTNTAIASFEKALELNPSDPMARFGLGLAQIRNGDLAQGRGNIEIAVGLDPSNALLRTYLGKAYFEERRQDIDGQQYEIAKELDPLDPTPYLYDAIRLQTINRPIEGLKQLQTSLRLNENRAVYRSQLLLDADRAARGTSLARIFQDLSFLGVGVDEATNSIRNDPTNPGAHRFLSDVYAGLERRETARVSELLQGQLFQDININPIQPAFAETNLNIVTNGGPATPGYSEFTPLFERNQVVANTTAVVGNNQSYGGEAVASALHDRFSVSGGVFDYRTDGWRDNMDIRHTIYDLFLQAALTPELQRPVRVPPARLAPGRSRHDLGQGQLLAERPARPDPGLGALRRTLLTEPEPRRPRVGDLHPRQRQDLRRSPTSVMDRRRRPRKTSPRTATSSRPAHLQERQLSNMITGGAFNYVKSNDKFDVTGEDATTEEIFSIFEDQGTARTPSRRTPTSTATSTCRSRSPGPSASATTITSRARSRRRSSTPSSACAGRSPTASTCAPPRSAWSSQASRRTGPSSRRRWPASTSSSTTPTVRHRSAPVSASTGRRRRPCSSAARRHGAGSRPSTSTAKTRPSTPTGTSRPTASTPTGHRWTGSRCGRTSSTTTSTPRTRCSPSSSSCPRS
ncbi:MAG: FecR domain-containing protein [Geminicoccaceae bacterium]